MRITIKGEPKPIGGGLWGQMSWERFAEQVLRAAGEISLKEEVVEVEITEEWLRFRIEVKK